MTRARRALRAGVRPPDRNGKSRRKPLARPREFALQARPVEARPRVLLAAGRDVLVAGDVRDRIALRDRGRQLRERLVLRGLEAVAFQAFELDADRIVVAVLASAPARSPGMPGAVAAIDELPQLAAAADVEVRRHLHALDRLEIRVRI